MVRRLQGEFHARREALSTTKALYAFTVFDRAFTEFGLPRAIWTDNGLPFSSGHVLYGLSKLSVWWLRCRPATPDTPNRTLGRGRRTLG